MINRGMKVPSGVSSVEGKCSLGTMRLINLLEGVIDRQSLNGNLSRSNFSCRRARKRKSRGPKRAAGILAGWLAGNQELVNNAMVACEVRLSTEISSPKLQLFPAVPLHITIASKAAGGKRRNVSGGSRHTGLPCAEGCPPGEANRFSQTGIKLGFARRRISCIFSSIVSVGSWPLRRRG